MWKNDFLGSNLQVGNEPAKHDRRSKTANKLSGYEPWDVNGPYTCKSVTKAACNGDSWIRKRR
jgi:hypothetical protein